MSDPYVTLGVAYDADDAAIRAAFHAHVRAGTNTSEVNTAYAAIRDAASRDRRRWNDPQAILAPLPSGDACLNLPLPRLATELAFLSDWELGVPHG